MKFGSVCSGIEAASVAWNSLGWEAEWFAEIEPFPSAVLAHHYPKVPNLGDITLLPEKILSGEIEAPDILCGGTPCQAFSVAGNRQSLDDARGNLTLTFCEIADAIDSQRTEPAIIFWENVPGVLNTKDNAFGCFLARLAGEDSEIKPSGRRWTNAGIVLGPKRAVAWRTLDAQYFGLAQRRKRVFVVASAREGFDPSKVLFEFKGVRRDTAPSRGERENIANCLTKSPSSHSSYNPARSEGNAVVTIFEPRSADGVPRIHDDLCPTLNTMGGGQREPCVAYGFEPGITKREGEPNRFVEEMTPTMRSEMGDNQLAVAHAFKVKSGCEGGGKGYLGQDEKAFTISTHQDQQIYQQMAVRRLTPKECERLQGFPDDYTKIPYRNKQADQCPDSPRYKALGNSWAVPVVKWIGERIANEVNK